MHIFVCVLGQSEGIWALMGHAAEKAEAIKAVSAFVLQK